MRLTSGVNAHLDFCKMKSTYGCNGKEKSCASSLKPLGRPSKCFKIVGSRHTYLHLYPPYLTWIHFDKCTFD